jgi:hypothetical protein
MKQPKQLPAVDRQSTKSATVPVGGNGRPSQYFGDLSPYFGSLSPYFAAM